MLSTLEKEDGLPVLPMSAVTEEGIIQVKETACDLLLAQRVEGKTRSSGGKKLASMMHRLHVAVPAPRDEKVGIF